MPAAAAAAAAAAKRLRSCAAGGDRWWSSLLPELLVLVLQRLPSVGDRVRFGCVCSWWRSALTEARHGRLLPPTAPLLMLPYTEEEEEEEDGLHPRRQVHRIPSNRVHRVLLPESQVQGHHHRRKKVICGSSMGWLLVSDRGGDVHLWNPVTRAEVPLPPPNCDFFCRRQSCVRKAVLSSSPLQDRCTVMLIRKCGCRTLLSFCGVEDDSWTTAARFNVDCYHDVNCYRGQFYAVTARGAVVVLDVAAGRNLKAAAVAAAGDSDPLGHADDRTSNYSVQNYLVESSGELLRVARLIKWWANSDEGPSFSTINFAVHKLDFDTKTWSKVVSLGDQALFLGSSSSVSCAAADGYKRNCIYFLDDAYDPAWLESDMGVFDLEDGSVTTFVLDKHACSSNKNCSPPILYHPQFWIDLAPW